MQSKPRWNRARGGLESPVYLRLEPNPARPALTVTHEVSDELRHFGPYLGGTRVREAVSALHPLAYASDRLSGSEAAMAEAKGVTPAQLPVLLATLSSVLERQPAAVTSALEALAARRDEASEALAFELAGRLHEEAQAVSWLTSTQRVTADNGANQTISGWSGSILVRFEIQAGRIRKWSQQPCSRDDAQRALEATPAAWTEFARENAELAARLQASSRPSPLGQ